MFCRFGSVLESRPVAAIVCAYVVWMRPSSATDFSSPSTVCRSRDASRCAQQVQQERVLGLDVEVRQRVGVGGVAGLGPLGLRHPELVEQHHLQLLRRAEVDLLADHGEGRLGGLGHRGREVRLQVAELVGVDRDAGGLHPAQHRAPAAARPRPAAARRRARRARRSSACHSSQHRAAPGPGRTRPRPAVSITSSQRSWPPSSSGSARSSRPQVAQAEVGQVVAALVRPAQVGGQRGVADAAPAPAGRARPGRVSGPLASCSTFGRSASASQRGQLGLSAAPAGRRPPGSRYAGAGPSAVATASPRASPRPRGPGPDHVHAGVPGGVLGQPARRPRRRAARPGRAVRRSRPRPPAPACVRVLNSRSRSTRNSSPSNTWCTWSRSHGRATRSSSAERQVEVAHQAVEPAVDAAPGRGSRAGPRPPCP